MGCSINRTEYNCALSQPVTILPGFRTGVSCKVFKVVNNKEVLFRTSITGRDRMKRSLGFVHFGNRKTAKKWLKANGGFSVPENPLTLNSFIEVSSTKYISLRKIPHLLFDGYTSDIDKRIYLHGGHYSPDIDVSEAVGRAEKRGEVEP